MKLTPADYAALERSWITREIADAAGIFRVAHPEAKDILVRRNGGGDLSGLVFPYYWPGERHVLMHRVRLDEPLRTGDGRPQKYLCAAGQRQHLYVPHGCPPKLLSDTSKPLIVTEGEKKCLSLWHMSMEKGTSFLPVAVGGVWNFRGTTGTETDEKGSRYQVKSPLPDLDRIAWKGRTVTILFDANASTNEDVSLARRMLASELMHRGANVRIANLPVETGINGCDDFLAKHGPGKLDEVIAAALPYDWKAELQRTKEGEIRATFANALTALRYAPEWVGVLAWDEFAVVPAVLRKPPWGGIKAWGDQDDRLTCEWMQRRGILMKPHDAGAAVQTVAQEHPFHPVREYLDGLKWDGTGRIDDWLTLYLGANPSDLTRAIAKNWMISAVARIYEPGCQADHCLILEGSQGKGKSSALRILGGLWFSDDLADLGTKDASLAMSGIWIHELAELDAMTRSEVSRINSFITRCKDRFRPPYGRRMVELPRQCVFAGTVNPDTYLRDDTGARRFWPVPCGRIDPDSLRRDRDQLWAEAVVRYRKGEKWHLTDPELIKLAAAEQEERYQRDAWEDPVARYIDGRTGVTIAECLKGPLEKAIGTWNRADESRVGSILRRLHWKASGKARPRVYRLEESE